MTSPQLRYARQLFALLGMSEATILPFFPLLLSKRGFDAAAIGAVLAAMALASVLSNPLWGWLADRRLGAETTLVLSAGAAGLLSLLLLVAPGDAAFVAAAIALTACRAPLATLVDAIALDRLPHDGRGDYGHLRLWMSLGWALAVLVWGAVLHTGSLELIPALYAGTSTVVATWALRGHARARSTVRRAIAAAAPPHVVPPALLLFLGSMLLVNGAFAATWNFLALRIVDLGGGVIVVGLAASLQALAEIPAMRASPRVIRVIGHRGLYVVGCGVYAVVFALWGFMSDPIWISVAKLVAGIGFAFTYVGSVVIVDDLVPTSLRASGQGFAKAVGFGLAPVAGMLAGGALYGVAGARTMFIVAGTAAALGGAAAWAAGLGRAPGAPWPLRRRRSSTRHADDCGRHCFTFPPG